MLTRQGLRGAFLVLVITLGGAMAQEKTTWRRRLSGFGRLFESSRVETLLVTGNFARSRVLAELAQEQRKHPILLISPEAGGNDELYFMPKRPRTEASFLPKDEFLPFIEFLKPRRVVVLGDRSYVSEAYVEQLRKSSIQTIVLNNQDWLRNAEALGDIIQYRPLSRLYANYLAKLELARGGGGVPSGNRAAAAAYPAATPAEVPDAPMMVPMYTD